MFNNPKLFACFAAGAVIALGSVPTFAQTTLNTRSISDGSLGQIIFRRATDTWARFAGDWCNGVEQPAPRNVTFVGLPEGDYRVVDATRRRINAVILENIAGSGRQSVELNYLGNIAKFLPNSQAGRDAFLEHQANIEKHPFLAQAESILRTPTALYIQVTLFDRRPGCEKKSPIDFVLNLQDLNVGRYESPADRDHVELDGFFLKGLEMFADALRPSAPTDAAAISEVDKVRLQSRTEFAGNCLFKREVSGRFVNHYITLQQRLANLLNSKRLPDLLDPEAETGASPNPRPGTALLRQTFEIRDDDQGTLTARMELVVDGILQRARQEPVVVPPRELDGCRDEEATMSDTTRSDPPTPEPEPAALSSSVVAPAVEQAAQPISCPVCPTMIAVAPRERHVVTRGSKSDMTLVSRPFQASRDEISVAQFRNFVAATGYVPTANRGDPAMWCHTPVSGDNRWTPARDLSPFSPGFVQNDDHPVVCVSWHDASAYADWLATVSGHAFRLLSEAEHQYITSAGTATPYWWGTRADVDKANFETGPGTSSRGVRATVAPGALPANPLGFNHVTGNAAEWVADCWTDRAPAPDTLPTAAVSHGNCAKRVIRGGGWTYRAEDITSRARDHSLPHRAYVDVGFRVAADH